MSIFSDKEHFYEATCKKCGINELGITKGGRRIGNIYFEGVKYEPGDVCEKCATNMIEEMTYRWMVKKGYVKEEEK